MSKNKFVDLPIGNYYGDLEAYEKDGVFYLNLDNYDGSNEKEIPESLYNELVKWNDSLIIKKGGV